MLTLILALMAAAPAAPPNTVSGVEVTAPPKTGPIAATVDMAADDGVAGDFVAIWPGTAYQSGVDGRVALTCLVDVYGLAERCQVAEETPKNKGLGRAALELRTTFKLTPAKGPDGRAVNATMSINVKFTPPRKALVGTEGTQAQIRSLGDIEGLVAAARSSTGNPLAMREVTMLDDPVWISAATFDDLAAAYPAKGAGAEGYVAVHCRVERSGAQAGALRDCQTLKESPYDHDFGKAALSLAAKFRLAPDAAAKAPNHTPVWVDIPIRLPPPDQLKDRAVMAPVWLTGLDPKTTPKLFPPEAVAAGLTTGRGVTRCAVAAGGVLGPCVPEPGEPDGLGFSEAAAKLASGMKMNLWSADGAPVEGGVVHVPVRLNLKGG